METFTNMFDVFICFLDSKRTPLEQNTCGHKSIIQLEDCLGLVLGCTRTHGSMIELQLIFWMTMMNLLMCLCFGCWLMVENFNCHHLAKISVPMKEKTEKYIWAIHGKHSHLENVWCAMDCLKLYLEQTFSSRVQEQYYNGCNANHFVSSVIFFCPIGTTPIAFSVHDSQIVNWGIVNAKLEEVYENNGGICVVDSAFGKVRGPYLIMSCKDPCS